MKVFHKTIAALALASLAGVAVYAARPIQNSVLKMTAEGGKITPVPAAAAPFNYYTGFEGGPISINPGTGFVPRDPLFIAPATHVVPPPIPFSGRARSVPTAGAPPRPPAAAFGKPTLIP